MTSPGDSFGRTLTSAWIETFNTPLVNNGQYVALSRVRGLKRFFLLSFFRGNKSHSHECVD